MTQEWTPIEKAPKEWYKNTLLIAGNKTNSYMELVTWQEEDGITQWVNWDTARPYRGPMITHVMLAPIHTIGTPAGFIMPPGGWRQ